MATAEPDRWVTVRAVGPIEAVAEEIHESLTERGVA
jgi:thymidylate kinase